VTEHPLNVSVSLPMTFAGEGQYRHLKATLNKLTSLKFRFGTHNPTVSKSLGQDFETLKTFVKKDI